MRSTSPTQRSTLGTARAATRSVRGLTRPIARRVRDIPRSVIARVRGAPREARGRDRGEERACVDAARELEQETRMIHEEDEARLSTHDLVDETERIGSRESRLTRGFVGIALARIAAESPRARDAAQIAPTLGVAREGDHAAGQPARIRDLRAEDRPHARDLRRGALEVDGSGERVDVGQRERSEAEFRRALEQRARRVDAGEEGVVAVNAERDVHRGRPRGRARTVRSGGTARRKGRPRRRECRPSPRPGVPARRTGWAS